MTTYTPNAGIAKPAAADRTWDVPLNANATLLDGLTAIGGCCVRTTEHPSTTLNVATSGGSYAKGDGAVAAFSSVASTAMTASATNYVYITSSTNTLTVSTSGFPSNFAYVPLAIVVAGAGAITSVTDARLSLRSINAHPASAVGTPGIAAGTGAGTGPTLTISGSDSDGSISLTTGTSPAASAVVATVTFGQVYGTTPRSLLLSPANALTAALSGNASVWADSLSTTGWTLNVNSTNLVAATAYKWYYTVAG